LVRDHFSIPNVFTPNGDDKNAVFKAITNSAISRFSIFTRDGSLVYSNNTGEWDGGQAPSGVYYWYVTYQGCDDELHEAKGWVHLLR
jgi:gliding motility-associated-like protein